MGVAAAIVIVTGQAAAAAGDQQAGVPRPVHSDVAGARRAGHHSC